MSSGGERPVRADAPTGHGTQNKYFFGGSPARPGVVARADPVVVGDVPQEPAACQPRAGLMEALERQGGDQVRVVFAVTGISGVGSTQVAAAHARRRIAEGWRLVAWVDASDEASLLAGLTQVAAAAGVTAGVGPAHEDARVLAEGVRYWLEADGERRLVVFDNAADLDVLQPFLPAAGAAQVLVTSSRRSAAGLGVPVPVDVFTEGEALKFLAERAKLVDAAGARELAAELGFLPLGLAQAAALIDREHLDYRAYLGRLRSLPVAGYPLLAEADAYPDRLAEAIRLSLQAVEARDPSGVCGQLMGLMAVLAVTGVPRRMLHLAASTGVLEKGRPRTLWKGWRRIGAAGVDASVEDLVDASLLGSTVDGESVMANRLVLRVARERLVATGRLSAVVDGAVRTLARVADGIGDTWRDPAWVRDLGRQVDAVTACVAAYPDALAGQMPPGLLELRLRSVELLNRLGDSTGQAVQAAESLAADSERLLGTSHHGTLAVRNSLATAYSIVGRMTEAIALHERTLSDRMQRLGADHPDTLQSRNNLTTTYQAAGRAAEAIPLLKRTLADFERLLPADHPNIPAVRNNLGLAYQAAGRMAEAIALHERTLADWERRLGGDHPDTLRSRNNLATAYQAAGRTAEAIPLLERKLADSERLRADHPDTLQSRINLATTYQAAGRAAEAIALHELILADCERLLGADHPETVQSRINLATAYQAAGRTAEADALHERTLADSERRLGADHPNTKARGNLSGRTGEPKERRRR